MANGAAGTPVEDLRARADSTSQDALSVRRQLTPTQRAGMDLAIGVGTLIALVTAAAVISYLLNAPDVPANLPDDSEKAKMMIDNYKSVSEIYMEQGLKVFEDVVLSGLLPVFTAILGYIFGTQTVAPSS